ncbi:MAG: hypothetical protein KC619_03465 [Myxococcales bacterium]|nr:hypothetical protein [Myxococcales bacterium]
MIVLERVWEMLGPWLTAFVLTQVVEMGVYAQVPGPARSLKNRLAIAFGASAITHPIVWFVIAPLYLPLRVDWWTIVAIAEAYAFVVEAIWLWLFDYRLRTAILASATANGLSFTIGLFCYEVLGW